MQKPASIQARKSPSELDKELDKTKENLLMKETPSDLKRRSMITFSSTLNVSYKNVRVLGSMDEKCLKLDEMSKCFLETILCRGKLLGSVSGTRSRSRDFQKFPSELIKK